MDNITYIFGTFDNKELLERATKIRTPNVGSIAYCKDSKTYYEYKDYGGWGPRNLNAPQLNLNMTVYEMNQNVISQYPDYTDEQLEAAKETIKAFDANQNANYYMLVCKDFSYYTIFARSDHDDEFSSSVIDCIRELGTVKAIDAQDNQIELWLTVEGKTYCFYLFNYDAGVIPFGR